MTVLVDRIWPRGLTKEHASVNVWLKDIARAPGLRTLFGHDPNRWREFQKRTSRSSAPITPQSIT